MVFAREGGGGDFIVIVVICGVAVAPLNEIDGRKCTLAELALDGVRGRAVGEGDDGRQRERGGGTFRGALAAHRRGGLTEAADVGASAWVGGVFVVAGIGAEWGLDPGEDRGVDGWIHGIA